MKLFLGVVLCAVACGGKFDGDDGGLPGNDGSTGTDAPIIIVKDAGVDAISNPPPPTCTPGDSQGTVGSNGSCSTAASWQCGTTSYSVTCSCPQDSCSCSEQSGTMGSGTMAKAGSLCANQCSGTIADLAALCGFPSAP